jgi:chemotaxis protein methyltransferase CheR
MVKFRNFNLLGDPGAAGAGLSGLDLIFCRNVLIYFDEATRKQVFAGMSRVMKPGGFLCLGGAETVIGISDAFRILPGERGLFGVNGPGTPAAPAPMPRPAAPVAPVAATPTPVPAFAPRPAPVAAPAFATRAVTAPETRKPITAASRPLSAAVLDPARQAGARAPLPTAAKPAPAASAPAIRPTAPIPARPVAAAPARPAAPPVQPSKSAEPRPLEALLAAVRT